jgi:glycosyltransferase involved in cell wall biosynthesis
MYQTSMSKGQELVAQRMVKTFRKLGHDAYLITSLYHDGIEVIPSESLPKGSNYVYSEESELGIPIIRVNSFIARWPPRRIVFKDFLHTLETVVNDLKLNILITHSTLWNGPEEVAKFVEWRRGIRDLGGYQDPIIFCHMSHFQEPTPKRYSLLERSFRIAWNRLALSQIFRTANLILVVTPYEAEAKVKIGAKREKCYLFPGGIDDESYLRFASLTPQEFFKKLNLRDDVKVFSFLGTIEERKNPKAIIGIAEMLQHRQDIHFIIAGHGDSKYADGVRANAQRLSNVTYLGEIDEREKILLIKASFGNVILSKLEALGLTQLEFMFQGVPVITSAVGGQSWFIRHEQEGIHVKGPDDIEGAANAVVRLVDDHSTYQRLSANAKKKAAAFAVSRLIKELDTAITAELIRETGLEQISADVRSTLSEVEHVAKSWSHGTRKVVATDRRLFIQHGWLSRRILEFPYNSITSIEHIRRYSWKTLLVGSIFTLSLMVEPYLRPIFSRTFLARVNTMVESLLSSVSFRDPLMQSLLSAIESPEMQKIISEVVPIIPISIGTLLFILQARVGFALRGLGSSPLYLPRAFQQAVAYIRSVQNQTLVSSLHREADEQEAKG